MTFMLLSNSAVQPIDTERLRLRSGLLPHVEASRAVRDATDGQPNTSPQGHYSNPVHISDPYKRKEHTDVSTAPLLVHEIMSSPALSLQADATVADAWRVLRGKRIHHLPIANKMNVLIGIISDRDLLRFNMGLGSETKALREPLGRVMRRDVLSATKDTSIRAAAEVLVTQRIGCLPITHSDGSMLGIVTRSDILRTVVMRTALNVLG